ncbi:hypothetical protein HZS_1894 [Henneguya salminicola]|nr:hypothetical protein HZS_1894 [Henneguya salminicola]
MEDAILICELNNTKIFSALLKAINISESVTVIINQNGLKFSSQESKSLQTNAYMPSNMFNSFNFNGKPSTFCVNLHILLNCINEFTLCRDETEPSPITLKYISQMNPFELELEEFGVVTKCSIKTQEPDAILDFDFKADNVVNKFILKSEIMKETFQELDSSCSFIIIFVCPEKDAIRITSKGRFGTSYVEFSQNSAAVEFWQCNQRQEYNYRMQLVKPSTKALSISKKFSLRIDHRGFLSLQHMVLDENGHSCFFEFLCSPEVII